MSPSAIIGVTAVVNPSLPERLGKIGDRSEIGIIAGALRGQNSIQRVMEIVTPLRTQAVTTEFGSPHELRIVEVAFGDQYEAAAAFLFEQRDFAGKLLEKMDRRQVNDCVHRIDPQSIEMIIAQPHERVVAEEAAHFVAATFVEINGVAPRRFIAMR